FLCRQKGLLQVVDVGCRGQPSLGLCLGGKHAEIQAMPAPGPVARSEPCLDRPTALAVDGAGASGCHAWQVIGMDEASFQTGLSGRLEASAATGTRGAVQKQVRAAGLPQPN